MSKQISVSASHPNAVSPTDLFNQIAAGVAVFGGQTVSTVGTETLVVSRKKTGALIVLICIFLFPIGLLALLARTTETITVTARDVDGAVVASASGAGDEHVVEFLSELL